MVINGYGRAVNTAESFQPSCISCFYFCAVKSEKTVFTDEVYFSDCP